MKKILALLVATLWYPLAILNSPIIILVFLLLVFANYNALIKSVSSNKKWLPYFILFFVSSSVSLIYNLLDTGPLNFKAELFIYILSAIIPMLVFYLVMSSNDYPALIGKLFVILILLISFSVVVRQVGLSLFDFDRELRLNFPFVKNDIAPTTFSLLLCAAIFVVLYVWELRVWAKWLFLALLLFFQFLLATRFAIVGSLLLILVHLARSISVRNAVSLVSGIVILWFVTLFVLKNNDRLNHRLSLAITFSDVSNDESLLTRLYLWSEALQIAKEAPLGKGYMYFVSNYGKIGEFGREKGWNTHNEFLLQLVGAGWIHFLIVISGLYLLVKSVWFYSKKVSVALCLLIFFSWFFDTASNNPGSINSFYITFMVFALILKKYDSKNIEKY